MDEMVFELIKTPDSRWKQLQRAALNAIENDRRIPKQDRLTRSQSHAGMIERKLSFWQLPTPSAGTEEFSRWLFEDPRCCPGSRLGWELFRALVQNENDRLNLSDLSDNAHFPAIPYVDFVTLDRRMAGYCRDICARLGQTNPSTDLRPRMFRSLGSLWQSLN